MAPKKRRAKLDGMPTAAEFRDVAGLLCEHKARPSLVTAFTSYFARKNPRFDATRFAQAAACKLK